MIHVVNPMANPQGVYGNQGILWEYLIYPN